VHQDTVGKGGKIRNGMTKRKENRTSDSKKQYVVEGTQKYSASGSSLKEKHQSTIREKKDYYKKKEYLSSAQRHAF